MRYAIFIIVFIVFANVAFAQQIKGIAICDVSYILANSTAGQEVQTKVILFEKILLEKLNPLRDELVSLKKSMVNAKTKAETQAEYDLKYNEYNKLAELYTYETQKYNASLYSEMLGIIQKITQMVMKERKITLVIKKDTVFIFENVPDITEEVLKRYNEYYENNGKTNK